MAILVAFTLQWIIVMGNSSRSEGRRPERSEVNKFVGPKARARELSRANSSGKYIYMCLYMFISLKMSVLLPVNSAQTKYE